MNILTNQLIGILSAIFKLETDRSIWPLIRIYRGGFLLIEFLFLLGINTYGWRQAGVNHVLIFELNPRSNLSHQHLFEVIKARQSSMNIICISYTAGLVDTGIHLLLEEDY